jgi:K+-transporting ATPase A subunit
LGTVEQAVRKLPIGPAAVKTMDDMMGYSGGGVTHGMLT